VPFLALLLWAGTTPPAGPPAAVLAPAPASQPLPAGSSQFTLPGPEPLTVFAYKPANWQGARLLVVCHGVGRDAHGYRDHAIPLADRLGALVVAPRFDARRYPTWRYQRGGVLRQGQVQPRETWTFAELHRLAAYVRQLEGRPELPYDLIGHSGGGQFLIRLAAFMPDGARRIVAANPGSLLFPIRDLPYPYGFGGLPPELCSDEMLRAFLAAPLTLDLGTGDVLPRHHLDASPTAMEQGACRLDRGRNCFELGRKLAAERHWAFGWRKVETPGVGHSAAKMLAAPEAAGALSAGD